MLTMLGSPRRCCDGLTRRQTLQAGALAALGGFGLPQYLAAREAGAVRSGKAKSVMLLYLLGGAATQDMFDLKPDAPQEVRSQFKPIKTSASGVEICEHLPQMARWMHKAAIVRTVNHKAGCHNPLPSYTGYEGLLADLVNTKDSYPPSMGSVCEYLRRLKVGQAGGPVAGKDLPDYVYLPCYLGWGQNIRRPGPYGGFLGRQCDALAAECEPSNPPGVPEPSPGKPQPVLGMPRIASSALPAEITIDRLSSRKSLLSQIDDQVRRLESSRAVESYDGWKRQAYDLLTASQIKTAFDLSGEDPRLVERYGKTLFGNSALIGRRLVERGVRFVNVTWDLFWERLRLDFDCWDTHTNNFPILKDNKLPGLDQTYSALLEDLDGRGLLDETLVVLMSEMGRTPRINANGGRDHWTGCYSVVLAGAGIRGGAIYGESDSQAAYVKDRPASTSDICATIYHCLGIDPEFRVPDKSGRPVEISHGGRPIGEILA
jgi:hypothetical protein